MNIIELLRRNSKNTPDKVALIDKEDSITYRELERQTSVVADFFEQQQVFPGQKILLFIPLNIEFYIIFLGLVRAGATVILIDPSVGRKCLSQCIQSVRPDALIATPKAHVLRFMDAVKKIPKKFSTGFWVPGSTLVQYSSHGTRQSPDFETPPEHPALITFTSGSTGQPKGVSRSHAFLINQHQAICRALPIEADDVELNTLPMFIVSNLASGITTVISEMGSRKITNTDAKKTVRQIQRHRVNRLLAAPAFCKSLSDYLQSKQQRLDTLKKIYTGGGPVFPNLLKQLSVCFPCADVVAVYGSTEAEPIAHISIRHMNDAMFKAMQCGEGLLTGKPVSEIALDILPDQDGVAIGPFTQQMFDKHRLCANTQGEIVVTGDHVQKAYLTGDESKTKFQVGDTIWHRTGDAGYVDTEGQLWLLGRCSAKIIRDGKTLYPFSLEAAAMSFREVEKAACVEINGDTILAIETKMKTSLAVCEAIQATLKEVDTVRVIKKIPVDTRHHSKVLYQKLKKILST